MSKSNFQGYICRPYCIFFKDGQKEEMACRGALVVETLARKKRFDPNQITRLTKDPSLWGKNKEYLGRYICSPCPFRAQDCDFQSHSPADDTEPCGGFILLALLLENNLIGESDLELNMTVADWPNSYLRLHPQTALKNLESPFLYHIGRDELYEIDERARDFLIQCNGTSRGDALTGDSGFVEYCREEGLLELLPHPDPIDISINEPVIPSLRYLELQLLHRCNLQCLHCYLGEGQRHDLSLADALKIAREFASLGGLRLMISGGEPLLYAGLNEFIAQTADLKVRRVLFTNGTLINARNIDGLKVEEIQFSLDGWEKGHDMLRGAGSFARAMHGIHVTKEAGIPVSFATMIHRGNIAEFKQLRDFMENIGALEWGIDLPVAAGSLEMHRDLLVPHGEAAPLMDFAYGGGYHGSSDGYACGRHLLTVLPTGQAVKCGFYRDAKLGDARQGLKECWLNLEHVPLDRLECRSCPVVAECAGGCRFRASRPLGPDPLMCTLYGIDPK